jgi:outer membrane protein assembly factor BamB
LVAALGLLFALDPGAAGASNRSQLAASSPQWTKFHYDLASTGFNPHETILSPSTVGGLQLKWAFYTRWAVVASPAVVDGVAYVANHAGHVFAIDVATGTQIWTAITAKYPSDITVSAGLVFIGSGHNERLYAFDAATGALRWYFQADTEVSSPIVVGDTVYVGTAFSHLYALRASDGTLKWESTFLGEIDTGLAAANGHLYAGDGIAGCVRSFSQRTGKVQWMKGLNGTVPGTPTVAGGRVFVGARNHNFYALDDRTGAILWSGDLGDDSFSSAAAAYGLAYIGSQDGAVYAFPQDCTDPCAPTWTFQTGNEIVNESPVVANGVVYMGSKDNVIYALDAMTGAELWS